MEFCYCDNAKPNVHLLHLELGSLTRSTDLAEDALPRKVARSDTVNDSPTGGSPVRVVDCEPTSSSHISPTEPELLTEHHHTDR